MREKQYICVLCPNSCEVTVKIDPPETFAVDNKIISVEGYECEKGKNWVINEITEPKRVFLGSVTVLEGTFETVSVKTSAPVPLGQLGALGLYTHTLAVKAPVCLHQRIAADVLNLGVDFIATRECGVKQKS